MIDDLCILIPSRIGSTRITNKPLIKLNNKTLIQRVMINALKVTKNSYVATDSELIRDNIYEISKNVILTKSDHISGTDRICEAANSLRLNEITFILSQNCERKKLNYERLDKKLISKVKSKIIKYVS